MHNDMNDAFQCDYCMAIFSDVVAVENHMYGHFMSIDDTVVAQQTNPERPSSVADKRKRGEPRQTHTSCSLEPSKGDEHKRNRRASNISCNEKSVKQPTLIASDERLCKCCICDKNFTNCFDYQIHVESESIYMEFQCKFCQMYFKNSELLKSHCKENRCIDLKRFAFDLKTDAADYEFCAECGNRFEDENQLAKHYMKEGCWKIKIREGISYKCGKCEKKFTTFNDWSSHEDTHMPAKHFRCIICLSEWSRFKDYNKHIETIHNTCDNPVTVLQCAKCDDCFDTVRSLLMHDKTHLDLRPLKCFACPLTFSSPYYLRKHREIAHGQLSKDMVKLMKRSMNRSGFKNHLQFRCSICLSDFSKRREYQLHTLTEHQNGSCNICNEHITPLSELKHHIAAHIGFTQCLFCNTSLHKQEKWSTHMPSCNASLFSCRKCGENFPDIAHLSHHIYRKHETMKSSQKAENISSKRSFLCEQCGKVCSCADKYNKHILIHSRAKMEYQCDDCKSKHFNYKSLMKHRHIHHNERKEFMCEVCNKMFASMDVVKNHLRRHRKDTHSITPPAFECDKCDQKFKSKKLLKRHRNVHMYNSKPYKCDQCEVAFTLSCNLTKHKVVHTGEKPYQCVTCKAAFNHRSTLTKHRYIHTRDFPHNCDECGIGFTSSQGLHRHTKRLHGPLSQYNLIPNRPHDNKPCLAAT